MSGNLRVLHAPNIVGGNPPSLAAAERALGLDSRSVSLAGDPFGFGCDELLWRHGDGRLRREAQRWRLFRRALRDFDVIHFNFGESILTWGGLLSGRIGPSAVDRLRLRFARHLELVDLPVLRRARKVIAVTYQGDDARQGDFCRAHFPISILDGVEPGYYTPWSDRRKRERIAKFTHYAHLVYALNPDLLHVLPRAAQFLPYANVDPAEWRPVAGSLGARATPVVLHAPSHRGVKGTEHVIAAVDRLRAEGVAVELSLVEGVKLEEAKQIYERADVVVDQLLAGWYGGFAVQAMALGKPVAAYIRSEDLRFIPQAMREELPVVNATPQTVYEVLRSLLRSPSSDLAALGQRSRAYVERWHDPLKLAARIKADYERTFAQIHRAAGCTPRLGEGA